MINDLKDELRAVAGELNRSLKKEFPETKVGNFLDEEGRLNMKGFQKGRRQGPYTEEEIRSDIEKVETKKDQEFEIDASNPKVMENYALKGAHTPDEIKEVFRQEREGGIWHQLEMAATIALHKTLPSEFITVRTSEYDDFENGVDNLIINKETGDVICTIDEVSAPEGSKREAAKQAKVKRKMEKGGAFVKYGLTYKDGKPLKRKIGNIPSFNLRLDAGDVKRLVNSIRSGGGSIDKGIMMGIIDNFNAQVELFDKSDISHEMVEKIMNFKKMTGKWKDNI